MKHFVNCADDVCHVAIRQLGRERQTYCLLPDAKAVRIILGSPSKPFLIIRMNGNTLIMHTHSDILGGHISDKLVPHGRRGASPPPVALEASEEVGKFLLVGRPYFLPAFP